MIQPKYTYRATIVRWVDGDSVWLCVDLGFRTTIGTDFRLMGIDTPERGKPGYAEAKARVMELAPAGTEVVITTHKNPDKYGRWLVEVHLPSYDTEPRTVNDLLIRDGLAVPYFGGTKATGSEA